MRFAIINLALCAALLAGGGPAYGEKTTQGPLLFVMKDIDGKDVDLAKKYAGKVCLIVNVASKCSLTAQYEQLTALHARYQDQGLAILAFPANDFEQEEPGTDAEIKAFCSTKFGVKFDLFSKISVLGEAKAPLYAFLTSKEKNGAFGGEIEWNFAKFLIGRDGQVVARFKPDVKPDDPEVVKALEAELAKESLEEDWTDLEVGTISGQANL